MESVHAHEIFEALDSFRIETPSWGFANTGTRLGKYMQRAAAVATEDKISDGGAGASLDGRFPAVALPVQGFPQRFTERS